ncbi:GH25 family lysozyme [Bosea sp. Root381]|uniref:glycoside hydrolase family 25 protein n=1 Tax=Bosea sp. Root381 TaxID=1736524 RepID=UPI0009ECA49A|nr:GH25 family lysozyme [Bosea sp. Root381]
MPVRTTIWARSAAAMLLAVLLSPLAATAGPHYPKKSDAKPHHGVREARLRTIHGIDVSRWQGEIDWARVKDAGTRFAFIKATEGGDHLDPNFRRNWAEAKRHGVARGAYHFVWWCRPARDQVRWMKRHIPRDRDALPPVLDVEWQNGSQCTRKVSREDALEKMRIMLAALEEHTGKKPIIYTDINFHEDILEGEFNNYPYWLRSTAAPLKHRYNRTKWEFWQFTTTGRVPGITGDVDRNAFYGTEREFAAWRDGRFDIGTRSWRGGEPKIQVARPGVLPTPPARVAGSRAGAPPRPPARVPSRTAEARN